MRIIIYCKIMRLSCSSKAITYELYIARLSNAYLEVSSRETAWKWFSSYLSCRTQFVSLGDAISNPSHIMCGVP